MALNFQQVRDQIKKLGENAPQRQKELEDRREEASRLLNAYAERGAELSEKVEMAVRQHDPSLRCALPVVKEDGACENLKARSPLPPLPPQATVLAADGSQINLDRHAAVEYCLVNVGAIEMRHGSPDAPKTHIECELMYDEQIYSITEESLALKRDMAERSLLVKLAAQAAQPVITFTDGPMELWGAKDHSGDERASFQKSMDEYLKVLEDLCSMQVATAGYVDKPSANLVVRLLEVAKALPENLKDLRQYHPLRGATDLELFSNLLGPGERSTVFAIQSQSAKSYKGLLALHFFYLNVGSQGRPWITRVEVPAWVVKTPELLNNLHALLIDQCRSMAARPYPYALHRAHETALVSLPEKDQVTQMILLELRGRGVTVGQTSNKQANKDLPGRMRYQG